MTDRKDEVFTVVALGPDTWELFEGLAGRHNGVFGGCWCIYFHPMVLNGDKARRPTAN